jgi:translocation and assembly module TamB
VEGILPLKKIFFILFPVLTVVLLFEGLYKYFETDIETFALHELESFSAKHLPVKISAEHFYIRFFSPAVGLSKIRLVPNDPSLFGFKEMSLENVRANLDFVQALGGRISISSLVLDSPELDLDIDGFLDSSGPTPEIDWSPVFNLLKKMPLSRLAVIHSQLRVQSSKLKFRAFINDLVLIASNQKTNLLVKVDVGNASLDLHLDEKKTLTIPVTLGGDFSLSPEQLEITTIQASFMKSNLFLEGSFSDLKNLAKSPKGIFKYRLTTDLNDVADILKISSKGTLQVNGSAELRKGLVYKSNFAVAGKELRLTQFNLGDVTFKGSFEENLLRLQDLAIHHPAGDLQGKDIEFQFDSYNKFQMKAKLESEQIDAHDLLVEIGVGDIPLEFFLGAKLDCDGPVMPTPDINCKAEAQAEQIEIRSGLKPTANTIAAVDEFAAKGKVRITDTAVTYEAEVSAKQDRGTSDGVISYKDGFQIHFMTPELHFENVRNLANLRLEGSGRIQGETSGDSHRGVFSINLDLKKTFFEDYFLGDTKGTLNYESGKLDFTNVTGTINNTHYSAKVSVDLNSSQISAEGQAPALELTDLLKAVERKATLPIEITGFGSAFIKLNGPLQFNQLSYNLSAQAFRGAIAGESYDRILADISAVNGEVKADKILIGKNKSVISVFGSGHPNGQIDLSIRGDGFLLEESENISKINSSISGLFNFQMGLTGHVLSPDLSFKGNLNNFVIEEQEFPSSKVNFNINKTGLEGSANLLGNRLKCDFAFPLSDEDHFRLKVQTEDWNFATLFALIGGANLLTDYQTSLTGTIDLSSERGGFTKATGKAKIDHFLLKRNRLSLENRGPMELNMKDGVASLSNFKLFGDGSSSFEIKGNQFTTNDLKLSIDSNANLRLFHIFVPFMEELGGLGKISASISGPFTRPQILGSAKIESGFAKIKGFPHPFERVNADIQFSASKVLITQFNGNLAGGTFRGDGQIIIEGPRNLPVNIVARVENANLNVPEGIRTIGDADISLSGNWFPFLLSGTYRVNGGLIDKEFGSETSLGPVKQSVYLPKVILQNVFEPIIFDVQVQLDKALNIKNSLIEGALTGQLQVKGPPGNPLLFGKILMDRNTKLMLRDQDFQVSSGTIQFKDPTEINPEFYISARSRVSDYDVSLLVQGTAKSPVIRLSSTPPLSESDLASLLALGVVSAKSDQRIKNQGGGIDSQTAMAAATSALLQQGAVKKAQDKIGVNIQLSSSYDDTKNTSVQKVTLSKKLTEKLSATASRVQGQQNSTEYKLRYNINNNVSTVGSYEERQGTEDTKASDTSRKGENILGIDLEYKREFKW